MNKTFSSFEELMAEAKRDKNTTGSSSITLNRYPIRFVLFDNFRDAFQFVEEIQKEHNCFVQSVSEWMNSDEDDVILTHSKLAGKIKAFVQSKPENDCVITPFSELARFYDNSSGNFEFNALIATIKGIEASSEAAQNHQRIYIPVVGLQGKMSKFSNDSQTHIWYFKNSEKQISYNLILTNGKAFNVQGLTEKYTLVTNLRQWLGVWRDKRAKAQIISTSPALFANAEYAQPDNAFNFCQCDNVYDFLTKGLELNFGSISYKEQDEAHWLQLAQEINVANFSLNKFFNQYFHIDDLADYKVFLKTWFACKNSFEKWLLINYYSERFCQKGYICQAIQSTTNYSNNEFFATIALRIFELEDSESYWEERKICLEQAAKESVVLSEETKKELARQLSRLAAQKGHSTAIRYFSPLSVAEKTEALRWLGKGKIRKEDCKAFFPALYNYLGKSFGTKDPAQHWVLDYIDTYKQCKIANQYSEAVQNIIHKKNASATDFNLWYQNFSTTATLLNSRSDIEVYYWIDGLGIDWIPFIAELLKNKENIHLNEVLIARAAYPSTTETNKPSLLNLSNGELKKIGDLDAHAHKQGNKYPDAILEEMEIVKNAVQQIVNEYAGKKIAIVSDHGLTALSQLKSGLNLAGVESDHNGRVAKRTIGAPAGDNTFLVCEDGETLCALQHESLCGKVPSGQLAHGGCTPEEVLVPIFIISSQPNASNYTAVLETKEIMGTNPVVKYRIKGLSSCDLPYLIYNGRRYELKRENDGSYSSERLDLVQGETSVTLHINTFTQASQIKMNLGAEEDDLFHF